MIEEEAEAIMHRIEDSELSMRLAEASKICKYCMRPYFEHLSGANMALDAGYEHNPDDKGAAQISFRTCISTVGFVAIETTLQ